MYKCTEFSWNSFGNCHPKCLGEKYIFGILLVYITASPSTQWRRGWSA